MTSCDFNNYLTRLHRVDLSNIFILVNVWIAPGQEFKSQILPLFGRSLCCVGVLPNLYSESLVAWSFAENAHLCFPRRLRRVPCSVVQPARFAKRSTNNIGSNNSTSPCNRPTIIPGGTGSLHLPNRSN